MKLFSKPNKYFDLPDFESAPISRVAANIDIKIAFRLCGCTKPGV